MEVGLIGEMPIEDFCGGFAVKGNVAGQQFVDDGRGTVDIDFGPVLTPRNLRCHVVDRPDALGLRSTLAGSDDLGKSDVTDLDLSGLTVKVLWLEIPMNDSTVVQVIDTGSQSGQPVADLGGRHPVRELLGEHSVESGSTDVLHHDPHVTVIVALDVVDADQVGVLEVEAQFRAAEFDFGVAVQQFQGDFLAPVAVRVVDLAETASLNAALDRVAGQRRGFGCEGEFLRTHPLAPRCEESVLSGSIWNRRSGPVTTCP